MRALSWLVVAACVPDAAPTAEALDVVLVLPEPGQRYDVVIPFEVRPLDPIRRYQLRVEAPDLPGFAAWLDEAYVEWEPSFSERPLALHVEVVDATTGDDGASAAFDVAIGWGVSVASP